MLKRVSYLIFITLLSTLLFACGGGGGGSTLGDDGGSGSVVDDVAPTISAFSPEDGATDVELTATLSTTFNENMFATTFDTGSFSFSDSNGTLAGAVNFDALTNIATFTPDKPLAFLTGYTASLSGDITDLSGNALSAESWSFTSRDGIWGTAKPIETDDVGDASIPQIAFDASGNALAVWKQSDGTRTNIWANRYTVGSGWGTAELIETDDVGDADKPQIAVDANGDALVVWRQFNSISYDIWANRYTPEDSWDKAKRIMVTNITSADSPQIAIDDNGNALAVWRYGGLFSTIGIWVSRYTPGVGWSTAKRIETAGAGNADTPQIVIDASGNALAVWVQSGTIMANGYTASSGWGTAESIAAFSQKPQIVFDASGNALAIWVQSSSIWVNRYIAGSGWDTAKDINTDSNGRNADYPQISVNASGIAIAVWEQLDAGGSYSIRVRHYTPDDDWGDTELVESLTDNAHRPQIAIDTNGNALAVWQQTSGSPNSSIWVNRYTPSGGWGDAELIELGDDGNAEAPQIAIDANGKALAVFSKFGGSRFNIEANRFE